MASPSPKLTHKVSTMNIAVVGLTSSSQGDQGEGTGKSCLCNKFIKPHADHYFTNHPYIVNLSEFGNSVINNCHFLYWGDKSTALEDGSDIKFRLIEHTEFVEDMSFKPFSAQKPYNKRIVVTKLQSGGKLQYVEPNQLTLPEDYPNVARFPDRSITIEGFILCVDVSANFDPDSRYRSDTLKLIQVVQGAKKPLVIALTKCDKVTAPKIAEVSELLSKIKRSPSVIEVSSHEGVNIDLCFLVLAHLIDSRKPKMRLIPYEEAYSVVKERKTKNEKTFKTMLDKKLTDFTLSKSSAVILVRSEPEWEGVAELLGTTRCERLVGVKLGQLQVDAVMKQTEIFKEILPGYLTSVLPTVSLEDTLNNCMERIEKCEEFDAYFVKIDNWADDVEFLHTFSNKVPLSFIKKEGKNIVQDHLTSLHTEIKRDQAKEKIRQVLEATEDLLPGVKAKVAMETLGLNEEVELLEQDVLVKLYTDRMNVVEQKCADDIHELLLERLDLFHDYTPDPKEITEKLMDEPCMKKMELALTRRNGIIVKHISYLEVLERGPYFTPEILDTLKQCTPSRESLQESMEGHWACNPDSEVFNLVLLSSSSEEVSILRTDIMNQCTGTDDVYEVNTTQSYQLRMKCCHTGNEDMTTEKFMPQGAVIVISSMEHLEWIGSFINRKFLTLSSPYHGLPCVLLVITDDLSDESELLVQTEQLAYNLQCILVSTPPTELPGRLVPPEIINCVLPSLFDNFTITHSFLFNGPSRELEGLNFGVFSLPGDPSSVTDHLKSSLLSSQLIHFNTSKGLFFSKTALERQHKVVSLSFYSTINARDFGTYPVLGFIVLFSTNRKASLSAVKWLIPRLHHVPIMVVAVCGEGEPTPYLEEGRTYAKEHGKVEFVVCRSKLEASRLSKFYSQCFFSRFTSWRNQGLSEEVSARILKRRGNHSSRPLPKPIGGGSNSGNLKLSKSLSRHSVALGGEFEKGPSRGQFATMSIKLSKSKKPTIQQPISLSDDELDDSVYSDPNEVIKSFKKPLKIASDFHKSNPAIPSSAPPPDIDKDKFNTLPMDSSSISQYAVVPSSNTIGKLDTLTRQRRAGHDTSPSRDSPDSTQLSNDSLYSPVKESVIPTGSIKRELTKNSSRQSLSPEPPPPSSIYPSTIYDHLTPRSQRKRMEQQQQQQGLQQGDFENEIYSLADESTPPVIPAKAPPLPSQPPPSKPSEFHLYGSFNSTQIELEQIQNNFSFVTEGIDQQQHHHRRGNSGGSVKRSQSPNAIYDFCEEPELEQKQLNIQSYNVRTLEGSPSPQRRPHPSPHIPPDYSSVPGNLPGSVPSSLYDYASLPETRYSIQTQSHEGTPEGVYSLAEDTPTQLSHKPITPPRQSSVKHATPPPTMIAPSIPPRPVNVKQDNSNYWSKRSGNQKGTTPTSTPPLSRAIEHVAPNPDAIYAIPEKKKPSPSSKKIQHVTSIDNPDSIYAIPDKPKARHPRPPPVDDDDDDDDDAPPPLPPRNYDLSDIEDDDEECFHSDDEDDNKSSGNGISKQPPIIPNQAGVSPQPIGVYATLDEAMDTKSKGDAVEDSLAMEQMESIYQNLNKFRKQQEQQQSMAAGIEEPMYDCLEKIIEDVNTGKVSQPVETSTRSVNNPSQPLPTTTMPTSTTLPKLSKKAIKLLKKNEKKAQKDIKKRLKLEAKQKKKEEEKRKKMEKALKKGKKIKQPIRKRYFESSLANVVEEDGIPSFVKACVKIVERDGLESVGLYRISGKREDILKVQEMYDNDPNVDIDSIGVCTNAITGTLKNFFKLLPESLIPEKLLTPLLDIPGSSNISDQIEKMKEIYSALPRANLKTLRFLCEHLNKVQQHHEVNKMSASNLSIVFWPTLMRPPILDMANPTKQLGWQLAMAKMIEHPECVPEVD